MSDSFDNYAPDIAGRDLNTEQTRAHAIRHALPLLESIAKNLGAGDVWAKADADDLRSVITDLRSAL